MAILMRYGVVMRIVLLALTHDAISFAQAADGDVRATESSEELFLRGTAAFEQRDFSTAYEAHLKAWEQHHSFRTAVGLGQVELYLGKYRDAAEHLSYARSHAPPDTRLDLLEKLDYG